MNTETKVTHTPGPWHISTQVWDRAAGMALQGETTTVRMNGPCDAVIASLGADRKECEANARLIAAAPELLEACKELLDSQPVCICHEGWTGRGMSDPNCGFCEVKHVTEQARAAIAKAEGGA